ncbi:hypothetical protein BDW74DRAFT_115550 [Aspergillus multicolor]|uniref:uncharacterized protein n=1 Tax=Aspergillus multicolor TaxID=41759 RepID=UPI003CCE2486
MREMMHSDSAVTAVTALARGQPGFVAATEGKAPAGPNHHRGCSVFRGRRSRPGRLEPCRIKRGAQRFTTPDKHS